MVDTIQNRIRALIKASKYQQNEVASHIGVTPQAITKWLNSGKIEKHNLIALCKLTNSNIEWVLEGKGEMLNQGQTQGVNEKRAQYCKEDVEILDKIHQLSKADQARLSGIIDALNPKLDKETNS